MAFIDFADWNPTSNDIFAYRFPNTNLSTATQLVVRESQEAVLFSKGRMMQKFGPGKHTLSTENIPLLRNLFGIPFGGKNPFTAEIWFVNKTAPLNISWRTDTMRYSDPSYNGASIPLFAEGRYGLKVIDAERFLVQLVGTLTSFTSRDLSQHFMGDLVSKTKSSILSFMNTNQCGINYVSAHLDELSAYIKLPLAEFWEGYGFNLEGYNITTVEVDRSTPEGKKIAEALAERAARDINGISKIDEMNYGVMNNAAAKGGMSGLLIGSMMMNGSMGGFGMNRGMQGGMQGMQGGMQGMQGGMQGMQGQGGYVQIKKDIFCANCGQKRSADIRFCSNCGKEYNPCPSCGADNKKGAVRCIKCGTYLNQDQPVMMNACSRCGTAVPPGTKFCPTCGNKIS